MPIRVLLAIAGLACLWIAAIAPTAVAKPVLAELRVEGPTGALDPGTWYVTDTEQIRASQPSDDCIRDQDRLEFAGPTALGIVQSGSEHTKALRQVRVRIDEAGAFVCEIGSVLGRPFTDPAGFSGWSFWHNQVSGSSSADLVSLERGDQVLWVFSDYGSQPLYTGDALELSGVPARDADGSFEVEVAAHAFDGSTTPADGVAIEGASSVTPLGGGRYEVTVPDGDTTLTATRGLDIPSNHVTACVEEQAGDCPAAHGRTIFGSDADDRIKGTRGWDVIDTGAGDDRIDLRKGGRDKVACGGGRDTVLRKRSDDDNRIRDNCERIRRR